MASGQSKTASPLSAATSAFEEELLHYEELAVEIRKLHVGSEKTLSRAKSVLTAAAACEESMSVHVQALLTAIEDSRTRQQACLAATLEGAKHVHARAEEFGLLMARFTALGQRARDVNTPALDAMARKAAGASGSELAACLHEVTSGMDQVIEEASSIAEAAKTGDWQELARAAESMKQQVQASRNKVLILQQSVAAGAPS